MRDLTEYEQTNLANWNERVAHHLVSYKTAEFVADPDALSGVVRGDRANLERMLGPSGLRGLSVVHLQCHIGTDTISLARLGAEVTGTDFSAEAIRAARELAERADVSARFEQATNEDAPELLAQQFDLVYTGVGAICWLSDLDSWARAITALLKPGGHFYIHDGHPILDALDYTSTDGTFALAHSYYPTPEPQRWDDEADYMDPTLHLENATEFCWSHSLEEIMNALISAGLVITLLEERRTLHWKALDSLVSDGDELWRMPPGAPDIPLSFSIGARKPS